MKDREIYVDARWENSGGIGTFYKRINEINNYKKIKISGHQSSPLDTWNSSIAISRVKNAVVFFPGYIPPLFSSLPYVITLHDLNHIDRKENSNVIKRIFYNIIVKRGCRKAAYIFTVSEFSKNRIIEWSGVKPEKVVNVGNGASKDFTPEGPAIDYTFEYLLCVSNRKAHKNEIGTLKAFKLANIDKGIKLVFTGKANEEINKNISKLGLQERVIFTGLLPEEELPKLYRTAKAVVFVSFYEGFGLPIIEAQASGTPVITSSGTALEEVAGDAALIVDPNNIDAIADGIMQLCTNKRLVKELVDKGFDNIKRYSWNKTAEIVDRYLKLSAKL
ncbi:glycosyltransferase family 4 protein [Klebsiella spallanzanii]|uniref:glycosyltransferase family 4 protein n=1 Tax=Klebsiella spallanzanii TaxID=2587528 RepID=UPI001156D0C2|nr:glycosyltransferase family 1 protein [Klebsiella spallanzanii]VUT02186.1 Mannosylfructose-phosphate synthase [Klebsiella spallanzanii]